MNVLKILFGREFDYTSYRAGHKTRYRIGNIIVYIILFIGILIMLSVPPLLLFCGGIISHNPAMIWLLIPLEILAVSLFILMAYGVSKTQMPEE